MWEIILTDRIKTIEKFSRIYKSETIITKILYCLALVQPYLKLKKLFNYPIYMASLGNLKIPRALDKRRLIYEDFLRPLPYGRARGIRGFVV